MKINHEFYDLIIEKGLDIRSRRIYLYDDVNEESISNLLKSIKTLEYNNGQKEIEIYISTFGGSEEEMFAAFDIISNSICPITTYAVGKIMSAGILIFSAGDKRISYPNTTFMCHQTSWEIDSTQSNIKETSKYMQKLEEKWAELMSKNSKISIKDWLSIINSNSDYYFDSIEAQRLGIVDNIIGE